MLSTTDTAKQPLDTKNADKKDHSTQETQSSNNQLTDEQKAYFERSSLYKYGLGDAAGKMMGTDEVDPLIKRERFAISLRKEKREKIITEKRRKTLESIQSKSKFGSAFATNSCKINGQDIPYQLLTPAGMSHAIMNLSAMHKDKNHHGALLKYMQAIRFITASFEKEEY